MNIQSMNDIALLKMAWNEYSLKHYKTIDNETYKRIHEILNTLLEEYKK